MRKLTFFKGTTDAPADPGDASTAGIDVFDADAAGQGAHSWMHRIELHGDTAEEAVELRDYVLGLITADKEAANA